MQNQRTDWGEAREPVVVEGREVSLALLLVFLLLLLSPFLYDLLSGA